MNLNNYESDEDIITIEPVFEEPSDALELLVDYKLEMMDFIKEQGIFMLEDFNYQDWYDFFDFINS